jgi:hypothetical protein
MKIATLLLSMALAAPAFACPNMDHDAPKTDAPRTADKDKKDPPKDTAKPDDKAKGRSNPADDKAKTDDKSKPADKKPGDKVSLK